MLNSTLPRRELKQIFDDLANGKTKMLFIAPESLKKESYIDFFKNLKISFYAVDEAHCISEWGHDFRPEYRMIRPMIESIGQDVPVISLTATATPKVQEDIIKNLKLKNPNIFISSFNRPNLYYEVRPKTKNINKELIQIIREREGKSGIIYCMMRKTTEKIAEFLQANGFNALPYHAGLSGAIRRQTQDLFLRQEIDIIVATIAFGMGIDKPDIRYVIHYDMPKSLEAYYQETGRAGRDGGEGDCIAFYNEDDLIRFDKMEQNNRGVAEKEIAGLIMYETISYAESTICRRKLLLHYFGEDYTEDNCHCCDNCLYPKMQFDAKNEVLTVLNVIDETKELYKAKMIVKILLGKEKDKATLKQFKAEKLKSYGAGADYDEKFWNSIIRQILILNFLEKDINNYGVLKITEKGREFLTKPKSIMLTRDRDFSEGNEELDDEIKMKGGSGADAILLKMLKDLRNKIAKQHNLPPFVIFQDPSLEEMTIQYPITLDELQNITGVGVGKAQKYGQPFVDLIKRYVEENEIERPNDIIIRTSPNASNLKIFIIQSIDRKIPLDEIAYAKNLNFDELLDQIDKIVASGIRIDIDYFIDDVIDPYHQEEIYEYFRSASTDDIKQALEELGENEYSEEEVRLMRIKFISEMGN
jgi:ATP-dependent DNA helicase RecQ